MPMPILPQKPPRTPMQEPGPSTKSNLIAQYKDVDGNWDFEKIASTGKQVMDVYGQVSPLISKFFKR